MTSDFDWRLHGVEKIEVISDNTVQIRAGGSSTLEMVDRVPLADGRILALPLPNATAMLLHASRRAYDDAQQLLGGDMHKIYPHDTVRMSNSSAAVDVTEYLVLSVFAAYTSLECFANEWIPPWVTFRKKNRNGLPKKLGKKEIERQLPLKVKLDVVLPSVFKVPSPKDNHIWESFVKLENARNRIVHMKQADRESGTVGVDTVWKMLFDLSAPHATAKRMVDWYMDDAQHSPGLAYEKLLPVKPRWLAEYPHEREDPE